eukprot:CAMPEP_0172573494 /NCGR_PEP_ID=MMETSP1067-20121228/136220_1 /TAXON_ID=265564 ORGANISM="Thalassiosira punctigera, Strain Tpunct2005C2" /NCGR_SAMPLE_ID=MMETSP1067 /ASSEMBLY_ACC=CAM_ASM_000444 /LENGTH=156 /DNA_ID=CAMNT_0013366099 /DNA_START=1451 /DNA_END=1921 /DNA_ORIENTATION=-
MLKLIPVLFAKRVCTAVVVPASQSTSVDELAGSLVASGLLDSAMLDANTTIHRVLFYTFPVFGVVVGDSLDGVALFWCAVGRGRGGLFLGRAVLAGEVVLAEKTNPTFTSIEWHLTDQLGYRAGVSGIVPVHLESHLTKAEAQLAHPLEPAVGGVK